MDDFLKEASNFIRFGSPTVLAEYLRILTSAQRKKLPKLVDAALAKRLKEKGF